MAMEQRIEQTKRYRVLIESLVTEGRVFRRGDLISAEDAPGEIENLLAATIVERLEPDGVEQKAKVL